MSLPWYRTWCELVGKARYRALPASARGVLQGLWCLAGSSSERGVIRGTTLTGRGGIADRLGLPAYEVRRALPFLIDEEWLCIRTDRGVIAAGSPLDHGAIAAGLRGDWELIEFAERNPPSISSTERSRDCRNRQRQQGLPLDADDEARQVERERATLHATLPQRRMQRPEGEGDGDQQPPLAPAAAGVPSRKPRRQTEAARSRGVGAAAPDCGCGHEGWHHSAEDAAGELRNWRHGAPCTVAGCACQAYQAPVGPPPRRLVPAH